MQKPTEGSFVAIMRCMDGTPQILLPIREDGKELNLIGGRAEKDEMPKVCAFREALEETGLIVVVHDQIGDDLPMERDGEVADIARVYRARCLGGTLQTTKESIGFRWVSADELPTAGVVERPCPGYPRGRTYVMAELALNDPDAVYSEVLDPEGLAT